MLSHVHQGSDASTRVRHNISPSRREYKRTPCTHKCIKKLDIQGKTQTHTHTCRRRDSSTQQTRKQPNTPHGARTYTPHTTTSTHTNIYPHIYTHTHLHTQHKSTHIHIHTNKYTEMHAHTRAPATNKQTRKIRLILQQPPVEEHQREGPKITQPNQAPIRAIFRRDHPLSMSRHSSIGMKRLEFVLPSLSLLPSPQPLLPPPNYLSILRMPGSGRLHVHKPKLPLHCRLQVTMVL